MLTRLMVFIDESGTTSYTTRLFTTAAVWCVPVTRDGYQSVLKPTAEGVWKTIEAYTGKDVKEIHYSKGLRHYADRLIPVMESGCHTDNTIVRNVRHWVGPPVTYTTAALHPDIEYRIARKNSSNFDCIMRSRAIISLLRPLFLYRGEVEYEVSVILDDNIWKKTIEHCGRDVESELDDNNIQIDFSTEPSKKAYGLQLADLVVGVARDYYYSGFCEKAFSKIQSNTIDHIGKRAIENVSPLDRG